MSLREAQQASAEQLLTDTELHDVVAVLGPSRSLKPWPEAMNYSVDESSERLYCDGSLSIDYWSAVCSLLSRFEGRRAHYCWCGTDSIPSTSQACELLAILIAVKVARSLRMVNAEIVYDDVLNLRAIARGIYSDVDERLGEVNHLRWQLLTCLRLIAHEMIGYVEEVSSSVTFLHRSGTRYQRKPAQGQDPYPPHIATINLKRSMSSSLSGLPRLAPEHLPLLPPRWSELSWSFPRCDTKLGNNLIQTGLAPATRVHGPWVDVQVGTRIEWI